MERVVRETAVRRARQAEPPLPSPAERVVQATGSGRARRTSHLADSPFLSPAERADLIIHAEAGRLVVQTPEETEEWHRRAQTERLMSEAIDELGASRQIAALNEALAAAQGEFPPISRDKTATVRMKSGGTYTYGYADLGTILAAVRPVLSEHGLSLTQPLVDNGAGPTLRTELRHADGGAIRSTVKLKYDGTLQEFGSELTYMRRYSVTSLLGIATEEDDDGSQAQQSSAGPGGDLAVSTGSPAPQEPLGRSPAERQNPRPERVSGAPANAAADGPEMISDAQHRKIGVLIKDLTEAWPPGEKSWADQLRSAFEVRSRTELTKAQASEAIEWLVEHLEHIPNMEVPE